MEKSEILNLINGATADIRIKIFVAEEITRMALFSSLHSLNKEDAQKIMSMLEERMSGMIHDQEVRMNIVTGLNLDLAKGIKEEAERFLNEIQKWKGQMKEQGRL